jgi:hypothetical protein
MEEKKEIKKNKIKLVVVVKWSIIKWKNNPKKMKYTFKKKENVETLY